MMFAVISLHDMISTVGMQEGIELQSEVNTAEIKY